MRLKYLLICTVACLGISAPAQEIPTATAEDGNPFYSFISADILTRYKSKTLPITSADRRGIHVTDGKRQRRLTWDSACMAKPKISLSGHLLTIENLHREFYYGKDSRLEDNAYRQIEQKNRKTAIEISMMQGRESAGNSSANTVEDLEEERRNYEEQIQSMIQEDRLQLEGHADSINLKFTLTAPTPVPEAYCAVMVGYRKTERNAQLLGAQRVAVKVHRLGDLTPASPTDVSFSLFLAEGDYRNARIELFFFSGDASPLPSNLSRQLKKLSHAEYEKLRR